MGRGGVRGTWERRPRRIREDAISRPADPLPWWNEVRRKSAWKRAPRGREDRPWPPKTAVKDSVACKTPQGNLNAQVLHQNNTGARFKVQELNDSPSLSYSKAANERRGQKERHVVRFVKYDANFLYHNQSSDRMRTHFQPYTAGYEISMRQPCYFSAPPWC